MCFFLNFLEFFLNILNHLLVESTDAESMDMGGQLCASTYTPKYLRMYKNSPPLGIYVFPFLCYSYDIWVVTGNIFSKAKCDFGL